MFDGWSPTAIALKSNLIAITTRIQGTYEAGISSGKSWVEQAAVGA